MSHAPAPPWNLRCPWCDWYIVVNARGMRQRDQGAGVEAAELMEGHVEREHDKTVSTYALGGTGRE